MHAARPSRLICILGTNTGVGKTYVAAKLLTALRVQGVNVAARKPIQSFDLNDLSTDAAILAAASGENVADVCPKHRSYPLPFAPPMAADLLHRPSIFLDELVEEIVWPQGIDVGVVETVGGPRSPLAHDGDSLALVRKLQPDVVVLVADPELGTLNAIRLSVEALIKECGPRRIAVHLNRYDLSVEVHRLNRQWLLQQERIDASVDIESLLEVMGSVERDCT